MNANKQTKKTEFTLFMVQMRQFDATPSIFDSRT